MLLAAFAILVFAIIYFATGAGMNAAKLNALQIRTLASNAGFTGTDLDVAVGIALAESGGNPQAYNPETAANTPQGMGSYGLWQIYLKDHPEFTGWNLKDPQQNAYAAYQVFQEQGFEAWSTYNSGAYQTYLA